MFITHYEEAIQWMDDQKNDIHRMGLEKIKLALNHVGNPHLGLRTIHIGGTNGKGSVTSYLKNMLLEHGLTVGTFTSPHIMKFNERMTFNGVEIDDETVIRLVNQMVELNAFMEQTPYGRLVFFELYTIMMFIYFNEVQPDVCLVEVGIGGASDCTNVIDSKDILITTIGLDHVEKLGDTYELIAAQKAGIIHGDADVFIGELPDDAVSAIKEVCQKEGAILHQLSIDGVYQILSQSLIDGSVFSLNNEVYHIKMLGTHQIHNASLAIIFFEHWMNKYGYRINVETMKFALFNTSWLGRMEKLSDCPLIFLDGAHNEAGLIALQQTMATYLENKKIKVIYTGLQTKNQAAHVELLLAMPVNKIVFTQFNHLQAMPLSEFKQLINEQPESLIEVDYIEDWQSQLKDQNYDVTIVTGSLYFISTVRKYMLNQ